MKFRVEWTVPNLVYPTRFIDEFGKTVNNGCPDWTICGGFSTVESDSPRSVVRDFERLLGRGAVITANPVGQ